MCSSDLTFERIILDLKGLPFHQMEKLAKRSQGKVRGFKVHTAVLEFGLPRVVESLRPFGTVMLDGKYCDTIDTVKEYARIALANDVEFITVHASGGRDMIAAAREVVEKGRRSKTKILAVLLLTSLRPKIIAALERCTRTTKVRVLENEASLGGAHGIIYAPADFGVFHTREYLMVATGIRLPEDASNDHEKTATPKEAIEAGAHLYVTGRPVVKACNFESALRRYTLSN